MVTNRQERSCQMWRKGSSCRCSAGAYAQLCDVFDTAKLRSAVCDSLGDAPALYHRKSDMALDLCAQNLSPHLLHASLD
jgi:hypothetical protein